MLARFQDGMSLMQQFKFPSGAKKLKPTDIRTNFKLSSQQSQTTPTNFFMTNFYTINNN